VLIIECADIAAGGRMPAHQPAAQQDGFNLAVRRPSYPDAPCSSRTIFPVFRALSLLGSVSRQMADYDFATSASTGGLHIQSSLSPV